MAKNTSKVEEISNHESVQKTSHVQASYDFIKDRYNENNQFAFRMEEVLEPAIKNGLRVSSINAQKDFIRALRRSIESNDIGCSAVTEFFLDHYFDKLKRTPLGKILKIKPDELPTTKGDAVKCVAGPGKAAGIYLENKFVKYDWILSLYYIKMERVGVLTSAVGLRNIMACAGRGVMPPDTLDKAKSTYINGLGDQLPLVASMVAGTIMPVVKELAKEMAKEMVKQMIEQGRADNAQT